MNQNILITSAGRRVSLVRYFKRELNSLSPGSKVFTTDLNPALAAACQVSDGFFKMERVTAATYIINLLGLCKRLDIGMLVPTIDTELMALAEANDLFKKNGIALILPAADFVRKCRDKRLINELFVSNGIDIPKAIDKHNPSFPLFIKPYDGSLSVDTFLIRESSELTEYQLNNPKLMFMEYISKETYDEYTVDMYFGKDNLVKCIVPRKRIEVRAGEVNKALTAKNSIVDFLKNKIGFIDGATGCLTVQVFLNGQSGHIVGIEINPRFGGGFPLSYQAGANFPRWLIQEYFFGEQINYTDDWEDDLLMLRYDDDVIVHGYKN